MIKVRGRVILLWLEIAAAFAALLPVFGRFIPPADWLSVKLAGYFAGKDHEVIRKHLTTIPWNMNFECAPGSSFLLGDDLETPFALTYITPTQEHLTVRISGETAVAWHGQNIPFGNGAGYLWVSDIDPGGQKATFLLKKGKPPAN